MCEGVFSYYAWRVVFIKEMKALTGSPWILELI